MLHESSQNIPAPAPAPAQTHLPTQSSNPNLSAQIEAENKVHSFTSDLFGDLAVVVMDNEPWFIAKQVASKLGYADAFDAVKTMCLGKQSITYKKLKWLLADTASSCGIKIESFKAGCLLIPLPDLFALIERSGKPEAKVMKDWLTQHVLPSIFKTGSYTMVTHPAAQANQSPALPSDTSLILKEMSTMVMNILQTVTDSTLKIQENMNQTLARIENSNQNLQSAFSQTVLGVTTQIQNTIKETSPESKWAYQGKGPLSTTQVARILGTTSVRLNTIMDREGLITPNDTNKCWLITNKGYPFCYTQGYEHRPKKYVINMKWDMSLVEYMRFNVAEFKRA